jgi:hypothetical protein
VARAFWFAGNTYIATTARGGSGQWIPDREGRFRLSVVDDHGRVQPRRRDCGRALAAQGQFVTLVTRKRHGLTPLGPTPAR